MRDRATRRAMAIASFSTGPRTTSVASIAVLAMLSPPTVTKSGDSFWLAVDGGGCRLSCGGLIAPQRKLSSFTGCLSHMNWRTIPNQQGWARTAD